MAFATEVWSAGLPSPPATLAAVGPTCLPAAASNVLSCGGSAAAVRLAAAAGGRDEALMWLVQYQQRTDGGTACKCPPCAGKGEGRAPLPWRITGCNGPPQRRRRASGARASVLKQPHTVPLALARSFRLCLYLTAGAPEQVLVVGAAGGRWGGPTGGLPCGASGTLARFRCARFKGAGGVLQFWGRRWLAIGSAMHRPAASLLPWHASLRPGVHMGSCLRARAVSRTRCVKSGCKWRGLEGVTHHRTHHSWAAAG